VVPDVLAVDTSRQRWPVRYLISRFIHGSTLASLAPPLSHAERDIYFAELGRAVGRLHRIGFDAFGEMTPAGNIEACADYRTALANRASTRIVCTLHLELFLQLLDRFRFQIEEVHQPAFTHEDLNHFNLLVTRTDATVHLPGILDLGSAWSGNPESDLARLELWRGMMHPTFWPAYLSEGNLAPNYALRRPLLQLLWCFEYAHPTPEHHAVTAQICAELRIPPIIFD
jgi:aminoglycoside phosphotransferase (APT) family kinase protein